MSPPVFAVEFLFPVQCQVMGNCWITNHVDLDDRKNRVSDYMCGVKATDNNKSTHISLATRQADKNQIVPVIATADGVVAEIEANAPFCGNRILLTHDDGWQSSYCHLRGDSLQVSVNQTVRAGQVMAAIGRSGQTDWPRLSFAVMRNGMIFDPFSGRTIIEGCTKDNEPLWLGGINPPYEPATVILSGFSVDPVRSDNILNGRAINAQAIRSDAPQLNFWASMVNIRKGDEITLQIKTPKGRLLIEHMETAKSDQTYFPIYINKNRNGFIWDDGHYTGFVKIMRRVHGRKIVTGRTSQVLLK